MTKLVKILWILLVAFLIDACGDSRDLDKSQMLDAKDSQVESKADSGIVSSMNPQISNKSNNKPTQDLTQSSINPTIAINCGKKEHGYEEDSQKCIITGSNSIEEAISAHLQSKTSDDYDVLRRINDTISTIKLPKDNVKVEYEIQVCLDDEIANCELASMSVVITRKSKDEIVIEYAPSAFYKKTYKQTTNGVEVINESYI